MPGGAIPGVPGTAAGGANRAACLDAMTSSLYVGVRGCSLAVSPGAPESRAEGV